MVYHPAKFPADDEIPSDLPFEDVWFEAEDGTRLHGWYLSHPDPTGVALFCHGNAGNMVSRAESLWILKQRHGLAVMTFDYRGYGKSEGKPTERGLFQDGRAARDKLSELAGVHPSEIILMGRSLGGAVAVELAARDGARGLVLASTFSSLPDTAAHHAPWTLPHLNMTERFDSAEKIKTYRGPLLQSHGDADTLIPIESARKLYAAAPGQKHFIVIPNADHNAPQSQEYREALDDFIRALPRTSDLASQ